MEHDYGPSPYMEEEYDLLNHVEGFMLRDIIDPLKKGYNVCPTCGLKTARWDSRCIACNTTLCSKGSPIGDPNLHLLMINSISD